MLEMDSALHEQLQQAKALAKHDIEAALEVLGTILETAVDKFGEVAPEAGPFYYAYGDTLLNKLETSTDFFGGAVQETIRRKEEEAKTEEEEEKVGPSGASEEDQRQPEQQEQEDDAEEGGEEDGEEGDEEGDEDEEDGEEGDEEGDEGGDNVDDLEAAWEILECARISFSKCSGQKLELAETHIRLGDLNSFNENFEAALEDYKQALRIRQEELQDENDRRIAEAHFLAAIALHSGGDAPSSIEHYEKAQSILKKCLADAESLASSGDLKGKGKAKQEDEDVAKDANSAAADLRAMISEIDDKIDDAKSTASQEGGAAGLLATIAAAMKGQAGGGSTSVGFDKPTMQGDSADVHTLNVKKRPADGDSKDAPDSKRAH